MRIESVIIENIRSHVKTTVRFSKGFNCLVGGLGAGKTSILYAIDFALFGEPLGRSYDYLLREGANYGKVILKFVEGGKEYAIWRGLRRRGDKISHDPELLKLFEGSKLIAETKNEAVIEQLKSITGLDKDIFRNIVWIRQERLKEILDMAPSDRQRVLDQLFGISDYETSWANIRSIQKWYESELENLSKDPEVVGAREVRERYDEAVRELVTKEAEIEDAKKRLAEAEAKLRETSARLGELMELRRRSDELRAKEMELKSRISALENVYMRLMSDVKERKRKISELEGRLETLLSQEGIFRRRLTELGFQADMTLQSLQAYINAIVGQISSIRGEEEGVRSEIKRISQRLSSLAMENKCPLCLQPLPPEYKEGLMKRFYDEIANYKQQLNELDKNAKELERLRSTLFTIFSSLQSIIPKREEIVRQIEDEKKALNKIVEEMRVKEIELNEVRRQLEETLSMIAGFDYSALEEAQKRYNEAFEEYSNIKSRVQILETQRSEIVNRLNNLKWRLDMAQKKMERLEKVKRILTFIEEARTAYRSIQPRIRSDFVKYLEKLVQQILDELMGPEKPPLSVSIDESYTPIMRGEEGYERGAHNLSGGERTFLAIAYRLGVGQIIMHLKSGRGLSILILDEPTESLGREDGSIDKLAEMLSRLKSIEQIIAVTHSEAFAEKADYVIRVDKREGRSIIVEEALG
ncbi:MAG: SMC family ATPase [Candidatus Bathyarchaeia archaeon]|nr:SMC family ATPase [Candidatus Bathyarchaeota archaeon]